MQNLVERFATCSKDCYGGCVFKGYWDDASPHPLLKTIASKEHPFTQGVFCGKLNNRIQYLYHKDRLKHPLYSEYKSPHRLQKVSMDFVYTKIAQKVNEVLTEFGGDAILGAFYSGNVGLISQYSPLRFFHSIGASITTGGICNEGGCAGLASLFGTYSTTNPLQLNSPETKLIIVWGSNLTENNNHAHLLVRKARQNGARLVVIDSRKTKIAKEADIFIPALPGTDHLIVKYILHSLIQHNSVDMKFLRDHVDGYQSIIDEAQTTDDHFFALLKEISSDSVQKIDEFIYELEKFQYHTIFNIGYGVQKDLFGGKIVKSIALIQILLGNLGKPGTGIIYSQSDYNRIIRNQLIEEITQLDGLDANFHTIHIRELGAALNDKKIKLLFVYNCNPASSLPNQTLLRKGLARKDLFVVVLDQFLNETTNYANVVIPAKFDVETYDFITPYYFPSISVNIAGPCPYTDCVSNHNFFMKLGKSVKCSMKFQTDKDVFETCLHSLQVRIQNNLKNQGFHTFFGYDDVGFEEFGFPTHNGKINGTDTHFNFESPIISLIPSLNSHQFLLITPNRSKYLHSQLGDGDTPIRGEFNDIILNSGDCSKIDLLDGDLVEVNNTHAKGNFLIRTSDELLSKTAVLFHGVFTNQGLNANHFTSDNPESMGFSGAFNSSVITVRKK